MGRVVVLGGAGFIGQHLLRVLKEQGTETVVYDLTESRAYKPGTFVKGNINDTARVIETIQPGDTIVHLVHSSIPSESNLDPVKDLEQNLPGFIKLLEALSKIEIQSMIYSSTGGQIYGDQGASPTAEVVPLMPISSYGIVKLAMEHYLRLFSRTHDLRYNVVRISNPYGPLQGLSNRHGAVPAIMRSILENKKFVMFGEGQTVRDYIYIDDVASALMGLIGSEMTGMTFNVGTGIGTSLSQLIEEIEGVAGKSVQVEKKPIRDSDVRVNLLDSSLLKRATGWEPRVELKEGLGRTWQDMLKHE